MRRLALLSAAALLCVLHSVAPALAQATLAEGFTKLPSGARIALMPADIQLFEISAGGVVEPRADWTEAASAHVLEALRARKAKWGAKLAEIADEEDAATISLNSLHGAVSRAVVLHHFGPLKLPTKQGKLDWTLGPDAALLQRKTGADYGLFIWIRDSYASEGRQAAVIVGVLFGVAMSTGVQQAHASLVDLGSGRVVWFNRVARGSGDLRERDKAQETLDLLLAGFPG